MTEMFCVNPRGLRERAGGWVITRTVCDKRQSACVGGGVIFKYALRPPFTSRRWTFAPRCLRLFATSSVWPRASCKKRERSVRGGFAASPRARDRAPKQNQRDVYCCLARFHLVSPPKVLPFPQWVGQLLLPRHKQQGSAQPTSGAVYILLYRHISFIRLYHRLAISVPTCGGNVSSYPLDGDVW